MWSNHPNEAKNSSQRRNKFEIWSEILEACLRIARTQSWLLRELNLKTTTTKKALKFLSERGLIVQTENEKYNTISYLTSDIGKEALIQYYNLITKYFKLK